MDGVSGQLLLVSKNPPGIVGTLRKTMKKRSTTIVLDDAAALVVLLCSRPALKD